MKVIPLGESPSDSNHSSKKVLTPIATPFNKNDSPMKTKAAKVSAEDLTGKDSSSNNANPNAKDEGNQFWTQRSAAEISSGKKRSARQKDRIRGSLYNVNMHGSDEEDLESRLLYDIHFQKSHSGNIHSYLYP